MIMAAKDSYNDCLETMYGLRRFGIILGLSTIKRILKGLGNPQEGMSFIHVAGTNGKGSIASTLSTILHLSGHKVGLYTSPHLVRFNERICINNRPISNKNVVSSYKAVKKVDHGTREPTFFEFATAMALNEFGRRKVDWAIVETGMGGRLDATNVIKPALSLITNISLEHKDYLGETISSIAREKGGIIKKNVPVVSGVRQKKVISILKGIAESQSAPFYRFGDAFRVRRNRDGTFNYFGIENVWPNMNAGLVGSHQIDNAALVLAACEVLNKKNLGLPLQCIKDAHCSRVVLTRPKIDRALAPEKLYHIVREKITDIRVIPNVDEAVVHAVETTPADGVICIAGSLYVVGEAKETFEKNFFLLKKNSD
jgi:dihydrofolate synthase/folylpolyglutamate synthase